MGWLNAENLVADAVKVIRNPETQESKGFAFIDSPNAEEMNSIIRRFDRAPLEDRLLRANPAQPPRPKGAGPQGQTGRPPYAGARPAQSQGAPAGSDQRPPRRGKKSASGGGRRNEGPPSPFAEELTNALN